MRTHSLSTEIQTGILDDTRVERPRSDESSADSVTGSEVQPVGHSDHMSTYVVRAAQNRFYTVRIRFEPWNIEQSGGQDDCSSLHALHDCDSFSHVSPLSLCIPLD